MRGQGAAIDSKMDKVSYFSWKLLLTRIYVSIFVWKQWNNVTTKLYNYKVLHFFREIALCSKRRFDESFQFSVLTVSNWRNFSFLENFRETDCCTDLLTNFCSKWFHEIFLKQEYNLGWRIDFYQRGLTYEGGTFEVDSASCLLS